jgi:hypothetical protein
MNGHRPQSLSVKVEEEDIRKKQKLAAFYSYIFKIVPTIRCSKERPYRCLINGYLSAAVVINNPVKFLFC